MSNLIFGSGAAYTLFYLSLAGILGTLIGKISFFGIKIGIAGVLFSGLLLGAIGIQLDPNVLHFVKELGLVFFVFTIGIQVGPGFFKSLKSEGLVLNLIGVYIVIAGVALAVLIGIWQDVPTDLMAGILSGAVTNTPGLGAAQQSLLENIGPHGATNATIGYTIAYPFGIMGIILAMLIIKKVYKVNVADEKEAFNHSQKSKVERLEVLNVQVRNKECAGKTIRDLVKALPKDIVISRIADDDNTNDKDNSSMVRTAKLEDVLQLGNIILAVGSKKSLDILSLITGGVAKHDLRKDFDNRNIRIASRKVLITKKKATHRTLREFNLSGRYHANLTRIIRSGVEFIPYPNLSLHLGDIVTIVAPEHEIDLVVKDLGDVPTELHHPNILVIFFGIFFGMILGNIAIAIPGVPAPVKLGMAGGPLIVALIMGRVGKLGPIPFYLHPGANFVLREIGIVLFLACVGLGSGKHIIPTLQGDGLKWALMGSAITFIPVITAGLFAKYKKINFLSISGLLSGSMTNPPSLGFANSLIDSPAQSIAYASVYPLTMILRIFTAQLFVLFSL